MSLYRRLTAAPQESERASTLTLDDLVMQMTYGGSSYPFVVNNGNTPQDNEEIGGDFRGYVDGIYKRNGAVFSCMAVRARLFSEARFQFQRLRAGRPGDLFGTEALKPLEVPWANGTTSRLLKRALLDVDLAGNFYAVRRGRSIRRLRPDWVTIVAGSDSGSPIDAEVVGYLYHHGGRNSGSDPEPLLPEFVAHFKEHDDPMANFRGMSWLTPVIGEILGDSAATSHKTNFFQNGANLGYVVTLDPDGAMNPEQFKRWVETFKIGHEGAANAYKTLFLSRGADVKIVGTDLKQLDFKAIQGAGETRIAAAAGVPAIIAGFSEGLESATYSNYGQARRSFADGTLRPLWRDFAGAMASIIQVPSDSRLWYDDRDIPFLQEDEKDDADIQQVQAATIRTLVDAGFTWESAVASVTNGDMKMLEHTGLFSVQLQPPGSDQSADGAGQGQNGNGQPMLPAST
jgi:phage portal protein BeeE